MSDDTLEAILREVKPIRSKVERLKSLIEERIIGLDEPLEDEVEAIKEYLKAKEKGEVKYTPLEGSSGGANNLLAKIPYPSRKESR